MSSNLKNAGRSERGNASHFAIMLYTGLRRGDVALLGPQHVRDGVITLRAEKTGTQVEIPILPELAEVIAGSRASDLAFVAKTSGAPMAKDALGHWFRRACQAAGCPSRAHGLRKLAATRMANAGFTEAELEAWFGWHGGRIASLYTRKVNRARLARNAITKLRRDGE